MPGLSRRVRALLLSATALLALVGVVTLRPDSPPTTVTLSNGAPDREASSDTSALEVTTSTTETTVAPTTTTSPPVKTTLAPQPTTSTSTTTCSPYRRCGLSPAATEPPTRTACTFSHELALEPDGGGTVTLHVIASEYPNTEWTAKLYLHGQNAQRAWDLGRTDSAGRVDFTLSIDPDLMGKQVDIESDSQMTPFRVCEPHRYTITLG